MSNNNLHFELIKENIKKIYIDVLKKTIEEAQITLSLTAQDNKFNLILELPTGISFDQAALSDQINKLLQDKFAELPLPRIIFSNKTPIASTKTKNAIPNVKKIILLASAKGGVGKSTTAVNLALALAKQGYKTGIVDADIYGPTIPKLLGINQKPKISENKMLPIEKHGIYSISIGYLIDENQAAIWRGPMISKTLYQLLLGVIWPKLDYLIIDMPPGTGDIYLSLAENFIIDGVILITTPQKIAQNILKKSISFFNKTHISIIGIVENMSFFFDEKNNITHNIFGENLNTESVKNFDTELLAQIPLIPKISEFGDKSLSLIEEKEFAIYSDIANKLAKWSNK